jgi:hypothetical protein
VRIVQSVQRPAGRAGFDSRQYKFISSPQSPNRLCCTPSPLPNGYRRQSGRGVKLTTRFHLVSLSRKVQLQRHSSIRLLGIKRAPWNGSASELYRPSDRLLSEKIVPTFADIGCYVISVTDPSLGRYSSLQATEFSFLVTLGVHSAS